MENKSAPFMKSAMNNGMIFGIILILVQLVFWMFNIIPVGFSKGMLMFGFNLLISVAGLYYFTKNYRDGLLNGFISYGQAFMYGWTVYLIATVVLIIYNFIFNQFIDPEYTTRVIQTTAEWTEEFMRSKGVPESQISDAVDKMMSKAHPSVIKTAVTTLIGGVVAGAIFSAISSAFAKKAANPLKEE